MCPAFNKTCSNCGKLNHFRKQCRLPVKRKDEANCIYAVSSKIASIKDIAKENQVTVNTRYGKLTLHIDIGATCNVIPTHSYMKLTGDNNLVNIEISTVKDISVYGEGRWPVIGEIILEVKRKKEECMIRGLMVEGRQCHPISERL